MQINNPGKEVYNSAIAQQYKSSKIICSDTVCYIICDIDYLLIIISNDLLLECTRYSSCYGLQIKEPPQTSANITWHA